MREQRRLQVLWNRRLTQLKRFNKVAMVVSKRLTAENFRPRQRQKSPLLGLRSRDRREGAPPCLYGLTFEKKPLVPTRTRLGLEKVVINTVPVDIYTLRIC